MDPEQIIGNLIGGFVGRKKHGGGGLLNLALGGGRKGSGLLTSGALLTAAGLVWGALESMNQGAGASTTIPNGGVAPRPQGVMTPPSPATAVSGPPPSLPPIPGATPAHAQPPTPVPTTLLPLVQLAVSAARADGELSEDEIAIIQARAHDLGAQALVDAELAARRPLESLTPAFVTPEQRQMAYALAYAIVHGEGDVSPGERMYLTQLSRLLALAHEDVEKIERETLAGE